jgi:hypothetical protein
MQESKGLEHSSQCSSTDIVYEIYLQFLFNGIIIKTKVHLSLAYEISADFWLPCLVPLLFLLTKTLKSFGFSIFWLDDPEFQ